MTYSFEKESVVVVLSSIVWDQIFKVPSWCDFVVDAYKHCVCLIYQS